MIEEDDIEDTCPAGYNWDTKNRLKRFNSWAEEFRYARDAGYTLVPPNYVVPHWSVLLTMSRVLPTLYVARESGLDEIKGIGGRSAGELGYPIFFKNPA